MTEMPPCALSEDRQDLLALRRASSLLKASFFFSLIALRLSAGHEAFDSALVANSIDEP